MADQTYVFIDGRYLLQRHKEEMQAFFGVDGDIDLSPILRLARATRAYDAIDYAQGPGETAEAWEARVLAAERSFAKVNSLESFHVRPGSVRRGKKREQKEVDVLLAVDMVTFGFSGTISKAVLIAGDVDLRPAVEELVRRGVVVHVWYHRNSFAQELPGAADAGYELRFSDLYDCNTESFQEARRIPRDEAYGSSSTHAGDCVRAGSVRGCPVDLRSLQVSGRSRFDLWITGKRGNGRRIWDDDDKLIEKYVQAQYGPIVWEWSAHEASV